MTRGTRRPLSLSPFVSVVRTDAGAILRTDVGAYRVGGADRAAFADEVLPLLDGTRDEEGLVRALPRYSRSSVLGLLGWLRARSLLDDEADAPFAAETAFLRGFRADPGDAQRRLAGARVLVVGYEPWGAIAGPELQAAGVGAVATCGDAGADVERGAWDLVLAALPPRADDRIEALAHGAHDAGVTSVWGHLSGGKAYLGPLVAPGRTACRVCAAVEALNPPLLDGRSPGAIAPLAARRLGHAMAMEAVRVISAYAPSALGGRLLVEDLESFETSLHTLVRLPRCRVCGAR